MADGLKDIIASLEQQRVAIEKALEALKEVGGSMTAAVPTPPPVKRRGRKPGPQAKKGVPATRKGSISQEGRKKLAEAMKRRWAAKRAAKKVAKATAKKATKKKAAA